MGFGLGFLFLFVCLLAFKTPLISTVSHFEVFLEFSEFVVQDLGFKAFWCPWQSWQGKGAVAALEAAAGWRPTTARGKGRPIHRSFCFHSKAI